MSAIDDLIQILKETGAKVTFDIYRDNTKGCGDHCRGWNGKRETYCDNHVRAIMRGDYLVPGGEVEKWFNELKEKAYGKNEAEKTKG